MIEWRCSAPCSSNHSSDFNYCGMCGAKRPVESDGLDEILDKSLLHPIASIKYLLRQWRDAAIQKAFDRHSCTVENVRQDRAEWDKDESKVSKQTMTVDKDTGSIGIGSECGPKKLAELMEFNYREGLGFSWIAMAEAVKTHVLKSLPTENDTPCIDYENGWNNCLVEVKKMIQGL